MGLLGNNCKSSGMGSKTAALLSGIGIGAALMYALDPEGGRRRRAMARDKALSFAEKTQDAVARRSRDLSNRARGVAAQMRSALGRNEKQTEGDWKRSENEGIRAADSTSEAGNGTGDGKESSKEPGAATSETASLSASSGSTGRSGGRKTSRRPEETSPEQARDNEGF